MSGPWALTTPGHPAPAFWASQTAPLGCVPGPSLQSRAPPPHPHTKREVTLIEWDLEVAVATTRQWPASFWRLLG